MPTVTARSIIWNTTAGNKTTGSFTPAVGDLLVAFVGIATLDTAPTMSDSQGGATWVLAGAFQSQAATGGLRCYIRNQPVAASSMTVTMTIAGDAGGGLAVLSVERPRLYGVARSVGGQADQTAATTPAPVLNLTPLPTSAILTAIMDNTNGSANATQRAGYTEHYDQGFNTPASGIAVGSLAQGETSATITYGGTTPSIYASLAVEIEAPSNEIRPHAMMMSLSR